MCTAYSMSCVWHTQLPRPYSNFTFHFYPRMQLMLVHAHPVTALLFSDDGRLLATYAYGDSALSVWQVQFYV